jgi:hypothetical protein
MIIEPDERGTTGEAEAGFAEGKEVDARGNDPRAAADPGIGIGDPESPPGVAPDEPAEPWTMDDERPLDS